MEDQTWLDTTLKFVTENNVVLYVFLGFVIYVLRGPRGDLVERITSFRWEYGGNAIAEIKATPSEPVNKAASADGWEAESIEQAEDEEPTGPALLWSDEIEELLNARDVNAADARFERHRVEASNDSLLAKDEMTYRALRAVRVNDEDSINWLKERFLNTADEEARFDALRRLSWIY